MARSPFIVRRTSRSPNQKDIELAAFNALPLLEQNRIKLEKLEREWSALGSLREITFTIFFGEKIEANSLEKVAKEKGFRTEITTWSNERRNYQLTAKLMMLPEAESVTRWEEWFEVQASKVPDFDNSDFDPAYSGDYLDFGADFQGWSYPKRLSPAFQMKDFDGSRNYKNNGDAGDRTLILFGHNLCEFEASNGWASDKTHSTPLPSFKLVPSEFLANARQHRPSNPAPTASMFSQWLYSLYAIAFGNDQDRAKGKEAEEYIFFERLKAYAATDHNLMRNQFSDWRLKHNGLNINKTDDLKYFSIDDLLVGGEPLRVNPDLIYENQRTRETIIVEIKHSLMHIPSNLWPNIWGQLWCYAQMEEVRDSPKVTVIGEVWGDKYYRGGGQSVYLRASVRRNPRSIPYDRFFRTLFDIYRGVD